MPGGPAPARRQQGGAGPPPPDRRRRGGRAPRARNARRSYRSAESAIGPPRLAPGWTRSPLGAVRRAMVDGMPPHGRALLGARAGPRRSAVVAARSRGWAEGRRYHADMRASMRRHVVAGPDAASAPSGGHGPRAATESARKDPSSVRDSACTARTAHLLLEAPRRALASRRRPADLSWGLRTAVVPWLVARVVVGGALAAGPRVRDEDQALWPRWRRVSTRACWGGTRVGTSPSPATGTPVPGHQLVAVLPARCHC